MKKLIIQTMLINYQNLLKKNKIAIGVIQCGSGKE